MHRSGPVLAAAALALALGGCSTGTPGPAAGPPSPGTALSADDGSEGGSDVGNDRPQVTYDGLMVRRRVVIALPRVPETDVSVVRGALERAAGRSHVVLVAVSPDVLDAVTLEELSPELVLALPPGRTVADAAAVVAAGAAAGRALPGVEGYRVATVLVHDLRFEVRSPDPQRLSRSIAREGILSDALGSYTSAPGRGQLAITYTGPLLSDELVAAVRSGIGRRAGVPPGQVVVAPRSSTGAGVDVGAEPAPPPAVAAVSSGHDHVQALSATAASPPRASWTSAYLALVTGGCLLALVLLRIRRPRVSLEEVSDLADRDTRDGAP